VCYSAWEEARTLGQEMGWVSTDEPKGEKMTRVTILFPTSIAKRIRALADQQATPFTSLLRLWVVQRLEDEERKRERDQ
jgi:hypothetical protein